MADEHPLSDEARLQSRLFDEALGIASPDFPGRQTAGERMAALVKALPDFSITLEGTLNGPIDLEILKPPPAPRKCEAWINVQSLYPSPGAAALPPHRLYCEVPAGQRHPVVVEDPTAAEPVSYVVHRANAICWHARSTPEDDDDDD